MGEVRPVWKRQIPVKLAVRAAQPSLRERSVGIERALKGDLLVVRRECAQHQKQVRILRGRRYPQLRRDGSCDLQILFEGLAQEGDAVTEPAVHDGTV